MQLSVDIKHRQGTFTLETAFNLSPSAVGIFGPSGCGKTTLFRAISGLLKPDSGHIALGETVFFDASRRIFVPPHKRRIGLVFQDARLFPHWSVEANLRAGEFSARRIADRPFSFADVISLLNVEPLLKRSVNALSGGEKQRIALGRALLTNPRLLLMDEPVSGLDAALKQEILPFLSLIHSQLNIPCILISHEMTEILQLTDYLLLLHKGSLLGQGHLLDLVRRGDLAPALQQANLMNVMKVVVEDCHPDTGICRLIKGNSLSLIADALPGVAPGAVCSVGIPPNEMALSRSPVADISMCNQIPGEIESMLHFCGRSLCLLRVESETLMVEITPDSARRLCLETGLRVWILFKSKAVRRIGYRKALYEASIR